MGEARKILELQKEIYAAYERELQAAGVSGPPELIQLKKNLYRDLERCRDLQQINRQDLSRMAAEAPLLLLGDYHSLPRCQQSAARFLVELSTNTGRPPVLALECFSTSHDPLLAAWTKGSISLETLRRTAAFDERWGFPWEGYAYLLSRIREHAIQVVGLEASPPRSGIVHRDQDMAERLAGLVQADPRRQVVAMVGDLHLSREALPTALARKGLTAFRIFQNMEPLYWRLSSQAQGSFAGDVLLDQETACILETHPLLKVQSALNWLDGLDTLGGEEECEGLTQRFLHLAETIATWLDISFSSPEQLHVLATDPLEFLEKLGRTGVDKAEISRAMDEIRSTGSFVHPPSGLVYLANPTINEAAEAATSYLRRSLARPRPAAHGKNRTLGSFLDRLSGHALGWLGSLLINPQRRPLATQRLARLFAEEQPEVMARNALSLARQVLAALVSETDRSSHLERLLAVEDERVGLLAAKILGERIGQTWFLGLQEDRLTRSSLRDLFHGRPWEEQEFLEELAPLVCGKELSEGIDEERAAHSGAEQAVQEDRSRREPGA